MAKCVKCFKDRVTGECYDVKDSTARVDIESLKTRVTAVESTLGNTDSELADRIGNCEKAVNSHESELFKTSGTTKTSRMTANETEISNLKTRVNTVEGVNTNQATAINSILTRVSNVESKANNNTSSIGNHTTDISGLKTRVTTVEEILSSLYPVGALYVSTSNTSPASIIGGTWEKITNKYLRASDGTTAGTTGGSNKLVEGNLPPYLSLLARYNWTNRVFLNNGSIVADDTNGDPTYILNATYGKYTMKDGSKIGTNPKTEGRAVVDYKNSNVADVLPEYLSVHVWKRTA